MGEMILQIEQNKTARQTLKRLYPKEKGEELYRNYQKRKIGLMIGLIIIGLVSALGLHLCSQMKTRLAEGAHLIRNEWGAGDYQINLVANTEEWSKEFSFLVEERALTREEKEQRKDQLKILLPEIIKGENQDLYHVTENLNFVTHVSGYPFGLAWKSDNTKRVETNGKVNREGIRTEGEWVTIHAIINDSQQNESETVTYQIYILQEILDEKDIFFKILDERLLKEDEKTAEETKIQLPQEINGKIVSWKEEKEDNSIYVLLIFLLGSILAGKGMDYDLRRNLQKRSKQLEREYAGFVNKLRLYLSAGLTVRNAFMRITKEYEKNRRNGKKHYLYEELKISCSQLENGMAEEQVYFDFGQRCGEMRFRRLSSLLGVQLTKGNDQLLKNLAKEADNAIEDQRNQARKVGEEAGTKLLFPMMLMLLLVMFFILLPAYLDFGSI